MALTRHEKQQYATPALVVAETMVPTVNDVIIVESLIRDFNWVEGSAAVADNSKVISQTSEAANGRWVAMSMVNVFTGTVTTDVMPNGTQSTVTGTVTGVIVGNNNDIIVTNANILPANVLIISKEVSAANTVKIVVENQSGASQAALTLNVKVLDI